MRQEVLGLSAGTFPATGRAIVIEHIVSAEELRALDAMYAARSPSGQPTRWRALVEELRQIRRVIEAGHVVQVEGEATLRTWQSFYTWAHGRYHMLEDGCDAWIGDDRS
jgi:heme oxygenase